jgi:hypothetical protein
VKPGSTVDDSIEEVAQAAEHNAVEMMRQVFLRALSAPPLDSGWSGEQGTPGDGQR